MAILLKGKKGVGPQTFEDRDAVVGTRSTCDLVVEDPMVAERHCVFTERDGKFFVRDLGTSSGTYVEGVSAEGETEISGEGKINVVFGVSKFICEIDTEKGLLTCVLKEQSFFYDKKEDPLFWSRSEIEMGRFRPVRLGNWLAVISVAVLFCLCFIDEIEEPLVEPGDLASVHGMEHWSIHAREGLAALAKDGIEGGDCAACHDGWSGTPVNKCATCHQSITHNPTHPGSWEGQSCQPCHVDHRGADPSKLTSITAEESCELCHEPDEVLAVPATDRPPRDDTPWVKLGFNTFPHSKHLTQAARDAGVIDCQSCHEFADSPELANPVAGLPRREFARIKYERCQDCHDKLEDEALRFEVTWHGTDDPRGAGAEANCTQCHQTLRSPELTQVARIPNARSRLGVLAYLVEPRSHQHEFDTKGKDCATCHRDEKVSPQPLTNRKFLHGVHLSAIDATSDAFVPGQCGECHQDVINGASARRLTSGAYGGPKDRSCAPCHDTRVPVGALRANLPNTVSHAQFPHDRHLDVTKPGLEKGCMSCHDMGLRDLRDPAVPTTLASAMDCASCHQQHDNVGGGACDSCHQPSDPVYSGKALMKLWPQPNTFSHKSRGHIGPTEQGKCDVCHKGTDAAASLMEVPIPSESDQSCRDCHINQRARFHWK